jgi:hypothetical protein
VTSQTILWTALPNGTSGPGVLRLSVHVAPRLETALANPTLKKFDDFVKWPDTAPTFEVSFGGGTHLPATVVTSPPKSTARWTALFQGTTPVKSFQPESWSAVPWLSYPVANVVQFLQDLYVEMATSYPSEHPPTDVLRDLDRLGRLEFLSKPGAARRQAAENEIATFLGDPTYAVPYQPYDPSVVASTVKDFIQLKQFHSQNGKLLDAITMPAFDFHSLVALLGSHPLALRRLGLVIDLEVGIGRVPPPQNTTVQVFPIWTPKLANTIQIHPATRCVVDPANGVFMAAPHVVAPELVGRSLPLGNPGSYRLVQVDPDGAAIKAMILADNLERQETHRTIGTPDAEALPALRSGGLSVARLGRATLKHTEMTTADTINGVIQAANDPVLDQEDVTRGYRIAVHDGSRWRSLLARHGEYRYLATGAVDAVDDEAVITATPTRAADGSSKDLRLPESLFSWRGWSLAAPRPGDDLDSPAPTIDPAGNVASIPNASQTGFQLETHLAPAPGSLPRLRFGTTYRVRARAVDLAGNSLPLDPDAAFDATLDAGPVVYGRFEPVSSPFVLLTAPRLSGDSAKCMVIRSDVGTTPDEAAIRHIAPPNISVLMAEQLGMFDLPASPGNPSVIDHTAWALVAPIEAQTYLDAPGATHDPDDYEDTPYYPDLPLPLRGLPDVFARSAAFFGLPGGPADDVIKVSFEPGPGGTWPAYRPFALKLGDGTGTPTFDDAQRILTVQLPQAETAAVRLSCVVDVPDLLKMGVWRWIQEAGQETPQLRLLAGAGRVWALTPWADLRLVHAVRRPMSPVEYQNLQVPRSPGDTYATMTDVATFHRKSTGKVEMRATWDEYVDRGPGSPEVPAAMPASAAIPIPLDREVEVFDTLKIDDRHEFGDTKHRDITYASVATTRFTEFFAQTAKPILTDQDPIALDTGGKGFVHGSVVVKSIPAAPGERPIVYVGGVADPGASPPVDPPDADYVVDDAAGTIARTGSSTIAAGAQVHASYVVPPVTQTTQHPVQLDVLSTARPPAPKVLYVLPAFDWSLLPSRDGIFSTRKGNLLRVYLDRPWFASGKDEMLGVVLQPPPPPLDPLPASQLRPYVTQIGGDPVHGSLPVTIAGLDSFGFATEQAHGLVLDEAGPGFPVDVAAHPIDLTDSFNVDRGLWFCDIAVDAGQAYSPFVRLALARYQSHSLPGLELSRVVLADFIQVAPDRFVTITFDPSDPTKLTVTLSGLTTTATDAGKNPGEAYVTIEKRDPTVLTDLGWNPTSRPVKLTLQPGSGSVRAWSKAIVLPEPRTSGNLRLVIEQYEVWRTDGGGAVPTTKANRIVFSDLVEL